MTYTKPALELIEEAVDYLRADPLFFLFPYYLGSLPFYLAFVFFVTDMRSTSEPENLVPESLGLALLYILMKSFQSLFALRFYDRIAHTRKSSSPVRALIRGLWFQTGVHASAFIIMPLALLATLPYVFVWGFYQSVLSALPDKGQGVGQLIRKTRKISAWAPYQNHMVWTILLIFKLGVLMNMGTLIYGLPQLMKSLFGIETLFTLGGFSAMNSTFIVTVYVLTHLAVDPLVKAVYTLRSFYGESEHTGEDLKARLVTLKKTTKTLGIALVLLVSIAGVARDVHGESLPDNDKQPHLLPPATLEKSVQEVISRREFAWRMPREKAVGKTEKGILDDVIVWMKPYVQAFRDTVKTWFEALGRWLKKMVHEKNSPDIIKGKEPKPLVRYLLYGLSALSLFLLAFYLIRRLRTFKQPVTPEDQNSPPAPDLSDETLKADDLPPSAWKTLAESLMADGEYRLAIRALYLATLSQLSEKRLITVAPYKSNREYLDELRMKAHEKLEMITLFNESVGLFDKVWYGRFSIGAPDVSAFSADQERIVAHAL